MKAKQFLIFFCAFQSLIVLCCGLSGFDKINLITVPNPERIIESTNPIESDDEKIPGVPTSF